MIDGASWFALQRHSFALSLARRRRRTRPSTGLEPVPNTAAKKNIIATSVMSETSKRSSRQNHSRPHQTPIAPFARDHPLLSNPHSAPATTAPQRPAVSCNVVFKRQPTRPTRTVLAGPAFENLKILMREIGTGRTPDLRFIKDKIIYLS